MAEMLVQIKQEPLEYDEYEETAARTCIKQELHDCHSNLIKAELTDNLLWQVAKPEIEAAANVTVKTEPDTDEFAAVMYEPKDVVIKEENAIDVSIDACAKKCTADISHLLQQLQCETKANNSNTIFLDTNLPTLTVKFVPSSEQGSAIYGCEKCGDSYQTAHLLRSHINMHKENMFSCTICKAKFSSAVDYELHRLSVHKSFVGKCKFCHLFISNLSELLQHIVTHANDCKFTCSACYKRFGSNQLLFMHWRQMSESCGLWMEDYINEHSIVTSSVNIVHLPIGQQKRIGSEESLFNDVSIKRIRSDLATRILSNCQLPKLHINQQPSNESDCHKIDSNASEKLKNIPSTEMVVSDEVVQNVAQNQRITIVRMPSGKKDNVTSALTAPTTAPATAPAAAAIDETKPNCVLAQTKIIRIKPNKLTSKEKKENVVDLDTKPLLFKINTCQTANDTKVITEKLLKAENVVDKVQLAELKLMENRLLPSSDSSSTIKIDVSTLYGEKSVDCKLMMPKLSANLSNGAKPEQVLDAMITKATEIVKREERVLTLPQEFMKAVEAVPFRKQIIDNMRKQIELAQNPQQPVENMNLIPAYNEPKIEVNAADANNADTATAAALKPFLLPLYTTSDAKLATMRRMYKQYRFLWTCPYCPRRYELKHTFRAHLNDAHSLSQQGYKSMQAKIVPQLVSDKSDQKFGKRKRALADSTTVAATAENIDSTAAAQKHVCYRCGRCVPSAVMLRDHLKGDCNRPQYRCPVCGKSFFSNSTLNCHSSIHTGELRHQCNYCPKRFRTRGQVTVHHRTHTGERPFVCQICSQSFTHRETLISHLSRHIGMKRYKCYGCNKLFSCISGLTTHRYTRPDSCGLVKFNSRAIGPRVRVIRGQVFFEPQPEFNAYLRTEDPQTVLTELQNQQQQLPKQSTVPINTQ